MELALSPSTPEYDCSKQMLAASVKRLVFRKYAAHVSRNDVHAFVVETPA